MCGMVAIAVISKTLVGALITTTRLGNVIESDYQHCAGGTLCDVVLSWQIETSSRKWRAIVVYSGYRGKFPYCQMQESLVECIIQGSCHQQVCSDF